MAKLIASVYEILEEIGSGGGGVVYLGRHTRLNKMIVLKADKRSLSRKPEALRREVDALKNLSHTYIPQVYDFVQEDGVVYTVMDYIEGESLDKPLKRREKLPQKQIVEWACELLEALAYLHNYPPYGILHSDIKPANIMITPKGDIRLIDFNIAQALGEEGAVLVGLSQGYASPEHYGLDFTGTDSRWTHTTLTGNARRGAGATQPSRSFSFRSFSDSSGEAKTIRLDKRSDIYSVGATLYHLFTGEKPNRDAQQVKPLTDFPVNPSIARILQKAMEPNPDLRYQSAEEMLYDFEHLHENDPRARRRRRHIREAVAAVLLIALAGGAMTYIGLQQRNRLSQFEQFAAASREALRQGNVEEAISDALQALPEQPGLYDPPEYIAPAQLALTNALGAYQLRGSYQPWGKIALPSEPVKARISPDGAKAAALVRDENAWKIQVFDLESGEKLAEPQAAATSQAEFLFPDNDTLLYAGADGLSLWDFSANAPRWTTGQPATIFALSPGGGLVATVCKDEQPEQYARFFDMSGNPAREPVSFGERRMRFPSSDMEGDFQLRLFALDASGHYLAASFSDGSMTIFDLWNPDESASLPPSDYTHFDGAFCGRFLGLSRFQSGAQNTRFNIFNMEADMSNIVTLDGSESGRSSFYRVQADDYSLYVSDFERILQFNLAELWSDTLIDIGSSARKIDGFYKNGDKLIVWTQAGENQTSNEYRVYDLYGNLTDAGSANAAGSRIDRAVIGGRFLAVGNDDQSVLLTRKLENHEDAIRFRYDASYYHQEARLRGDGAAATLFSYAGFRMVNADGSIIREVEWDTDTTYDPQYRRPGDKNFLGETVTEELLEMRFQDGWVDAYSASTGELLYRQQGDAADTSRITETFLTKDYKVVCEDRGAPRIYAAATGEALKTLESLSHISYVTQVGERLILQYMADIAEERKSGVMLDKNLEEVAELPELSDILPDGALIFDDTLGNLRQSRIYSIQELISMGKG